MDMRRHEGARRQRRMPGKGMVGTAFRHIGLAEDIPGNSLHALVGPGDAGDLVFHFLFLPSLSDAIRLPSSFETHRLAMLLRMRSQTLMVRSASSRVSNNEAT